MELMNFTSKPGAFFPTTAIIPSSKFQMKDTMFESEKAIFLGAPIALVVLALSATCCIVLLRWKIRDRLRQTGNDLTTHGPLEPHQAGKHLF